VALDFELTAADIDALRLAQQLADFVFRHLGMDFCPSDIKSATAILGYREKDER